MRLDAHHHLWDLSAVSYPWLEARGVRRFFGDPTPIQRGIGVYYTKYTWGRVSFAILEDRKGYVCADAAGVYDGIFIDPTSLAIEIACEQRQHAV